MLVVVVVEVFVKLRVGAFLWRDDSSKMGTNCSRAEGQERMQKSPEMPVQLKDDPTL